MWLSRLTLQCIAQLSVTVRVLVQMMCIVCLVTSSSYCLTDPALCDVCDVCSVVLLGTYRTHYTSLSEGERVSVLEECDDGWWKVCRPSGRKGGHIPGTTEATRNVDRTLYVLYTCILLVHSLCVTMATSWSTPI